MPFLVATLSVCPQATYVALTPLQLLAVIEALDIRLVRDHTDLAPGFEDAIEDALTKFEDAYEDLTGLAI